MQVKEIAEVKAELHEALNQLSILTVPMSNVLVAASVVQKINGCIESLTKLIEVEQGGK